MQAHFSTLYLRISGEAMHCTDIAYQWIGLLRFEIRRALPLTFRHNAEHLVGFGSCSIFLDTAFLMTGSQP